MIDLMEKAARAGGEVLLKYFRKDFTTSHKTSHHNIVTEADTKSQKIIYETILSEMLKRGFKNKDIGFIGEEGMNIEGSHKFVIDPLDGTTNFSVGLDLFCIPIAYAVDNVIRASVVYLPLQKVFYFAQKGQGAYKTASGKTQKLRMGYVPLQQTVVSVHFSSISKIRQKQPDFFAQLFPKTRGIRNLGSIALDHCLMCDNLLGGCINFNSYIWDLAATSLIIEEAGGSMVDFAGKTRTLDFENPEKGYKSLACHTKNINSILSCFR